ncbi:MAG TPA: response regulator [Rhizomicrobium sp.]|nr:response regulator [Rhizomicrobium sp.]
MSGHRFDKLKILVVDDNAHMRKLVLTILRAFGALQIFEAKNCERAWTLLCEHNPDVVLLDWMMEGTSGIELARKIRTDPHAPDPLVPLVMLSGHTRPARVQEARDAGINEFIDKRVSVKTLIKGLTAVIRSPRPDVRTKSYLGPCRRRRNLPEYDGTERRAAMNRAEKAIDQLKGDFAEWAQDEVRRLAEARQLYAGKPDVASRAALLRVAHDMKGQAATFNFPLIARVAGSLATLLHDLPDGKELSLALVGAHVDAIQVIHREKITDVSNKVAITLARELEARVADILR